MEFKKEFLDAEFKNYYRTKGIVATHLFVYSIEQEEAINRVDVGRMTPQVNNMIYSEMRSRDSELIFNWEDTEFVAVGTYDDMIINKRTL